MSKVIAVANHKGGVGKTTTTINLGASLAAAKRRILLLDLDPQGNTTTGSGVDKHALRLSTYDVLMGNARLEEALVSVERSRYALLPGNSDLIGAETGLLNEIGRELRLRHALRPVSDEHDYILIDCPPALNLLTVNALVAADAVMIPMQCEYYALEGLSALLDTVEKIRALLNPRLHVHGLLRTMYDSRNNLSNEVSQQLVRHFGALVYSTVVPRNVRLAEAPSHGLPALLYERSSAGALAYLAFAGEVLRRDGAHINAPPPVGADAVAADTRPRR